MYFFKKPYKDCSEKMKGIPQKSVLKAQVWLSCPTEAGRKICTLLPIKQNKPKTIEGSTRDKITVL